MADGILERGRWCYETGVLRERRKKKLKSSSACCFYRGCRDTHLCVSSCRQPYLFEEIVSTISRQARETVVACGPREGSLFVDPANRILCHATVRTLFVSFARCLQRLAFSGCEEAMDNDETSVSQLIGSPSGYRDWWTDERRRGAPVSDRGSAYRSFCFYPLYVTSVNVFFFFLSFLSDVGAVSLDHVEQYTIHAVYRFTENRRYSESARLPGIIHRGRVELRLDAIGGTG